MKAKHANDGAGLQANDEAKASVGRMLTHFKQRGPCWCFIETGGKEMFCKLVDVDGSSVVLLNADCMWGARVRAASLVLMEGGHQD